MLKPLTETIGNIFTVILAHAYIIPPNFKLSFDFRTTRHNGMIFGTVDQNTRTALYLVMFEGKVRNLIFCIHKVKNRILEPCFPLRFGTLKNQEANFSMKHYC